METTCILTLMAIITVAISVSWMAARFFGARAIRTAYVLGRESQLKQVMEWLKTNTEDYGTYFLIEAFLDDFKKAMRPATTTRDNS